MSLSDKDVAMIFKKDAGDYMIAAEKLKTDQNSIWLVGPTYFMRSHAIELLLKAARWRPYEHSCRKHDQYTGLLRKPTF
jgi:hypothetical protein